MASRSRSRSATSRRGLQEGGQVRVLARLHQTEMPLRQSRRRIARQAAEHRQADRLDRFGDACRGAARCRPGSARRRRCGTAGSCGHEAARDGGGGLRLAGHVQHQQHRQAAAAPRGRPPRRCGRAARRSPSNSPIADSTTSSVAPPAAPSAASAVEQRRRHGPAIEVDARGARWRRRGRRGRCSPARDFRSPDRNAPPAQCGEQCQVTVVLPDPERGAATISRARRGRGVMAEPDSGRPRCL